MFCFVFFLNLSIVPQISCKIIKLLSWKEFISWLVRVVFTELVWYLFSSPANINQWHDEAGTTRCSLCLQTTVRTVAYRQLFEGSFSTNSTNTWLISLAAGTVAGVLPLRDEVLISIIYRGKKLANQAFEHFGNLVSLSLCWCDLIFRFVTLTHSLFQWVFLKHLWRQCVIVSLSVHMFSAARMPGSKGSY